MVVEQVSTGVVVKGSLKMTEEKRAYYESIRRGNPTIDEKHMLDLSRRILSIEDKIGFTSPDQAKKLTRRKAILARENEEMKNLVVHNAEFLASIGGRKPFTLEQIQDWEFEQLRKYREAKRMEKLQKRNSRLANAPQLVKSG